MEQCFKSLLLTLYRRIIVRDFGYCLFYLIGCGEGHRWLAIVKVTDGCGEGHRWLVVVKVTDG